MPERRSPNSSIGTNAPRDEGYRPRDIDAIDPITLTVESCLIEVGFLANRVGQIQALRRLPTFDTLTVRAVWARNGGERSGANATVAADPLSAESAVHLLHTCVILTRRAQQSALSGPLVCQWRGHWRYIRNSVRGSGC